MKKSARAGLCLALLLALIAVSFGARAECPCDGDPPWPAWVFGHIVWEDESTTASVHEMVDGYKAAGVPVDGIIIDSPWETAYNTFEADPKRYPDLGQLVKDMHAQDIRVIMWITPNVNLEDPEYRFARDNGYFVKGFENRQWWKGAGGWIDYENPEAMRWWHARMDRAITLGIDGWKCDGTDPYLLLGKSYWYQQRYARAYYSDLYDYTRGRTGGKQVVMARPYESGLDERTLGLPGWTNPLDLAVWLKFAPIDKSWASWVGDQDPTFDGMTIARRRILYSAKKGYLILGSDIGGYREKDGQGPQKEIFIRWAQFGALCPFMENGGGGEHRAFKFDKQTLDIYRELVFLHKALLPYLYSEAVEAWREGRSIIIPLAEGNDEYLLGRDILVAPVTAPGGKVRVALPPGDDWMPLYADEGYLKDAAKCLIPGAAAPLLRGGCSFTRVYPLDQYPVFFRAGALIPMARKYAEPLVGGPAVASCPLAAAGVEVACPSHAGDMLCSECAPGGPCPHHPAPALGDIVLVVPLAPGKSAEVGRTVYMEDREPVEVSGSLSADEEFSGDIKADGDWQALVAPELIPAR